MTKEQIYLEENTLKFSYIGREWNILRADMEKLWEKMVQDSSISGQSIDDRDERLPYWAELWPSSLALAEWLKLNQENIYKSISMDLGCGLGFTALCGASLGAFVIGADYESDAIALAKENALANNFKVIDFSDDFDILLKNDSLQSEPCKRYKLDEQSELYEQDKLCGHNELYGKDEESISEILSTRVDDTTDLAGKKICCDAVDFLDFRIMDWRLPSIPKHSLDFIWAADIVYERAFVKPILDFLEYALKDTGKAWIAEPSRTIFEHFPEMLKNTSLEIKHVYFQETEALSAHIPKARVNIWEIRRESSKN